ncbi:aromatic acid/H+ symport family MFS transporter [Pseudomonas sp. LS1212]|uniref:MFS transporter n=1 Tax=Pseudomonas sp. LS1212 TaxID=2972478 RepID=UPI00215C4FD3|nr:aromatic acid/H+ symport family MFS transporter [Pseudomonas sp. LS1212]UVJ46287.1 aromatic acid/H+ symport family MFS transporter [Pseudomonas sp. LS1212]
MRHVNVLDVVDSAKLNRFHYLLVFWCSFIMLFDGYDLVIYGSVLPHLMTEWNLSPSQAGVLGASSMAGMMAGAFTLGTLADHLRRRKIILFCVALFSLAALASGFTTTPTEFTVCRFLTGVGLGGVVPNLVTILKEMSPGTCRNRLINFMLSFFAIGGLLSGLVGIYVIPQLGWQAPFYIAGLSCLALPLLYKTLPESVAFLVQKNRQADVSKLLRTINAQHRPGEPVVYGLEASPTQARPSFKALFGGERAISTLMLWLGFGMCMLMVYGLNTWLPKLMNSGGYPLSSSIGFLVIMNVGALTGTLISGYLADRWGCKLTLVVFFALAAVSISLLGIKPGAASLYALLLLAGGSTVGCLSVIHTFAADLYPAHIRSTGVSLAAAIGRCGAVAGPLLGGFLFSLNLPFEQNFLVFAVPGLIAVIAVLLVAQPRALPLVQQPSEGV